MCSDRFLKLSFEAQALFIQLTIEGDAYGFVSSITKILRATKVDESTLDELIDAGFVIQFSSGVIALVHWNVANTRKTDRTDKLHYPTEFSELELDARGVYIWKNPVNDNIMYAETPVSVGINPVSGGIYEAVEDTFSENESSNLDGIHWNPLESQRSLAEPSVTQRNPAERSEENPSVSVSGEGARGGGNAYSDQDLKYISFIKQKTIGFNAAELDELVSRGVTKSQIADFLYRIQRTIAWTDIYQTFSGHSKPISVEGMNE